MAPERKAIRDRLVQLASKHGWTDVSEALLDGLWHLRRELVHEAVSGYFDAQAGHARHLSGLLWTTQYFVLLAVIFAIESCESKSSLLAMWSAVSSYEPSLVVTRDQIPPRYFAIEWSESQDDEKVANTAG